MADDIKDTTSLIDLNLKLRDKIDRLTVGLQEYADPKNWQGNQWCGEGSGGQFANDVLDPTPAPFAKAADTLIPEEGEIG